MGRGRGGVLPGPETWGAKGGARGGVPTRVRLCPRQRGRAEFIPHNAEAWKVRQGGFRNRIIEMLEESVFGASDVGRIRLAT